MAMLMQEGFRFENYVDVFDAGPQVVAETAGIKTIAASRQFEAIEMNSNNAPGQTMLVCTRELARFRLAQCTACVLDAGMFGIGSLAVEAATLASIGAKSGDMFSAVV